MRSILVATLLALAAAPTYCQDPEPTEESASPAVEDLVVGDGDAPVEGGSFQFTVRMWTDRFDGTPFGPAEPLSLVQGLDSTLFTGVIAIVRDMKVGGKRRAQMRGEEFFGEKITRMGRAPRNTTIFFEVTLDNVWKDQLLTVTTIQEAAREKSPASLDRDGNTEGERTATDGDTVKIHYSGWTDDFGGDKKFDSSRDRDAPFVFELGAGQVIEGWERGVHGMKVGEKRHLSVPHHLAYGNRQQGPLIKPYSRLYFEVVLEGFVTLVIDVVNEGEGAGAKAGDKVEMHYTGWTDGFDGDAKFDSSRDRGSPFSFQLGAGQVIRGWDQGILGMKPGEVRRLTIPPEFGYGNRAMGKIPSNSTLYFDVEYLGLEGE